MAEDSSPPKSKLPLALLAVAGVTSLLGFAAIGSIWMNSDLPAGRDRLLLAQDQYLSGQAVIAGRLAEPVELDSEAEDHSSWRSLQAFLIGSGRMATAETMGNERARRLTIAHALPFLKESEELGFPPGRDGHGQRLIGVALFEAGDYLAASDALKNAINNDLTSRDVLLPALAKSLWRGSGDVDGAIARIEEHLALPTLSRDQKFEGEMIRIQLLLEKERWDAASEAIANSRERILSADLTTQNEWAEFRDELRLFDATLEIDSAIKSYGLDDRMIPRIDGSIKNDLDAKLKLQERQIQLAEQIAPTLRQLSRLSRETVPRLSARAKLVAARAYRAIGNAERAINQLTAVRQQRPFGAEAFLASINEIEQLASQKRGLEVLQTIRYVMREIGNPKTLDTQLISKSDFKARLVGALEDLRQQGVFEHAIDASRSLSPMFDASESWVQEGLGFKAWAEATLNVGRQARNLVGRETAKLARVRFRAAGDAFEQAAKQEFTNERYLPLLWSAIESYQSGRHFTRSIKLLEPYLKYEERRKQPLGLIAYGRALLAEGKPQQAIDALETCIVEFREDPLRYDARLMAAHAAIELHNQAASMAENAAETEVMPVETNHLAQAKALLRENLEGENGKGGDLRPSSAAWRDSLFTLSTLLYEQINVAELTIADVNEEEKLAGVLAARPVLRDAIVSLSEVTQRYKGEDAETALYYLARCHRLSARWAEIESRSPDLLDAARRTMQKRGDEELARALAAFTRLRRQYQAYEEEQRLNGTQDTMLRNCLIAEADTLFDMKNFTDAATAYQTISLRYRDEPIALEAFLGQIDCVRRLNRTREVDLLIRQAGVVLERIPDTYDDKFAEMTRFDRNEWKRYLDWMQTQVRTPSV